MDSAENDTYPMFEVCGYKYRMIDNISMPLYITPSRYQLSRAIETRDGDICFTSFPKAGSTWLSYVLYLVTHNGMTPKGDYLRANVLWVESTYGYVYTKQQIEDWPSPRIFKSHMPYHMAVGGGPAKNPHCKYIYMCRNPKDTMTSYFNFERNKPWNGNFNGTWDDFFKIFMRGEAQRGDWFDHVLGWWSHRHAPNVHIMKYESLLQDFELELMKLVNFLGYNLDEKQILDIKEQTEFSNIRRNSFSNLHDLPELKNKFYRKGQIGSWKNQLSEAQNLIIEEMCSQRLHGTGLEFRYE